MTAAAPLSFLAPRAFDAPPHPTLSHGDLAGGTLTIGLASHFQAGWTSCKEEVATGAWHQQSSFALLLCYPARLSGLPPMVPRHVMELAARLAVQLRQRCLRQPWRGAAWRLRGPGRHSPPPLWTSSARRTQGPDRVRPRRVWLGPHPPVLPPPPPPLLAVPAAAGGSREGVVPGGQESPFPPPGGTRAATACCRP